MDIVMERLTVDGATVGALVRRLSGTDLRVLEAYRTPDVGLFVSRTTVEHPGDVRDWTRAVGEDPSARAVLERPTPTTISSGGRTLEVPAEVLPRCAAPLVLADMLAGCSTETEGFLVEVSTHPRPPVAAHFSVGNPETVQVPGTGPRDLGVAVLYEDDQPTDRYWFDSHEVVLSRCVHPGVGALWGRPCQDQQALLEGLHPDVAREVRDFLA